MVLLSESFAFYSLEAVTSYKEEHFLDRELPPYYPMFMVAITNNCEAYTEFALQMEVDYS